ncbi:MAG: metallophosphoesterase, partial [Acidobacteria bacterium]|nr:metallophosphoesterase [Acidobacteriota bacterium]
MQGQMRRREFLGAAAAAAAVPLRAQQAPKTVVVGDVHGDPERFADVLSMAGLIDGSKTWSGGNTVLVQLGDMVDRGPDPKSAIELLQKLEKEAKKAKGKVYGLIGNHEAMRMYGDLRYVPAGEYESFRTKKSEQEREKWYMRETSASESASDIKSRPDLTLGYRQKWEKEHPDVEKVDGVPLTRYWLIPPSKRPKVYTPHPL